MKKGGDQAREIFKNNLNRFMDLQGITQSDITSRLKVSSATASDWVNGVKYPRVDAMQALANLLDVNMSDLISENDNQITNNDTNGYREQLRRQPGMRTLFDAAKGATDEQLEQFVRVIKAMRNDDD